MPAIEPGRSDQRRFPRWPGRWLVASVLSCSGYGSYTLIAAAAPWPLPPGRAHTAVFTVLLLGLCAAAVTVLSLLQRERGSRHGDVAAAVSHLAHEVHANRARIDEIADRTLPIIYTNPPPRTPATDTPTMSRDDYWRIYADVLVDLAAVGGGGDSEGGVHPLVHP